jgi:DNA adenine methylase
MIYLKSPLNYMGGKYKILDQIIPVMQAQKPRIFVDLFAGAFNVGINMHAEEIWYNDSLVYLPELMQYFKEKGYEEADRELKERIKELGLRELSPEGYYSLRDQYNESKNPRDFFLLSHFCFSNMIRFNKHGDFNMPFGNRGYTQSAQDNLKFFCDRLAAKQISFTSKHFMDLDLSALGPGDMVYCDPPYILSCGVYNDSKSSLMTWGLSDEKQLLKLLDSLNEKGVHFALNNVALYKGGRHGLLINWGLKYKVKVMQSDYSNCNYQRSDRDSKTLEVLVTNF